MTSSRSPQIDWGSLLVRLTPVAKKMFKQNGFDPNQDLPGTCVSVEFLVNGAAIEFFEWCGKGKWKRKTIDDDPFPLAYAIMRRNFIDLTRSASHKRSKVTDQITDNEGGSFLEHLPAFDRALNKLLINPTVGFAEVEAKILAEEFYPYAEGNQDLRNVIDAVVYCQCRKPSEIAEWLDDISPQEVTDRWEKLRYNYTRRHQRKIT
jgi:hypothetical protein